MCSSSELSEGTELESVGLPPSAWTLELFHRTTDCFAEALPVAELVKQLDTRHVVPFAAKEAEFEDSAW